MIQVEPKPGMYFREWAEGAEGKVLGVEPASKRVILQWRPCDGQGELVSTWGIDEWKRRCELIKGGA